MESKKLDTGKRCHNNPSTCSGSEEAIPHSEELFRALLWASPSLEPEIIRRKRKKSEEKEYESDKWRSQCRHIEIKLLHLLSMHKVVFSAAQFKGI